MYIFSDRVKVSILISIILGISILFIAIDGLFQVYAVECGEQVESGVYYVLPIAGPYEIRGVLFRAYLYTNISVNWREATVSSLPLYIDGVKVVANHVGEAILYISNSCLEQYEGSSGRLYSVNNTLWFIPFTARDGTPLPKTEDMPVFRVGKPATIVYHQPAKLVILWVEKFGNPKVEESLKNAGIVGGVILDLEPMPIADYSILSTVKIGEGMILVESESALNGTKFTLYLVKADDIKSHGIDKMIENYAPFYTIFLGGPAPFSTVSADIFVFIIANSTYMRAWRLIPSSRISPTTTTTAATTTQSSILTTTIQTTTTTIQTSISTTTRTTSVQTTTTTLVTVTTLTTAIQTTSTAIQPVQTTSMPLLSILAFIVIITAIAIAIYKVFIKRKV